MNADYVQQSTESKDGSFLPQTIGDTNDGGKCGLFGRIILLILPVFGSSMVLTVLYLLVNYHDITVNESSISYAMANYEPYWQIMLPLCLGVLSIFIVTISRNIQISVYHDRLNNAYSGLWILNLVAAMANIGSYSGFVLLALTPLTDDASDEARDLHMLGTYMYFGLGGFYGLAHIYLLCKQSQYPLYCKIIFTIVPLAMTSCSTMFLILVQNGFAYEWFAAALFALFGALFTNLFLVDPVDDEIRDFFFCHRIGTTKADKRKATI